MSITAAAVTIPALTYENFAFRAKKSAVIPFNEPLTILGMVVAAVALKLVPKFSAHIVTNTAQNPVPKPMIPVEIYNCNAVEDVKKTSIPIIVIT